MFLTSKSFVLLWLFMGRKMRKKYFQKHGKNISFCVSSKSSLFEVAILNLGLEGSNLRILRLGRAHMPRNIQNYWFLTKNNHVKKSVPKICNSPRALALNETISSQNILFLKMFRRKKNVLHLDEKVSDRLPYTANVKL